MIQVTSTTLPIKWDPSSWDANKESTFICLDIFDVSFKEAPSLELLSQKLNTKLSLLTDPLLESSANKYLITLESPFFHAIHDSITLIFKLASEDPTAVFVLYRPREQAGSAAEVYDYLKEVLSANNISYLLLEPQPNDPPDDAQEYARHTQVIKVTNYLKVGEVINKKNPSFSLADYRRTSDLLLENLNLKDSNELPYRKVYLSRSHIVPREYITKDGHIGYKDDQRIYDEHVLEQFFSSLGYEIVIPEEKFKTFEEQVRYMSTVSVLASVTSSGLSNNLLMRNGQTVIEISAELVFPKGPNDTEQTLFNSYTLTSYAKNHSHLLIPSSRDPNAVIDSFRHLLGSICP